MSEEYIEPTSPAKVDPESLVLRGSPPRVVRFRRGAMLPSPHSGQPRSWARRGLR